MTKFDKIINKVLRGTSDNNIEFEQLCKILKKLGFEVRIKGSHHIYYHKNVEEIINLQPKLNKAKPYQVKQVREILIKYKFLNDAV